MRSRVRLKLERMQQGLDDDEESPVESDDAHMVEDTTTSETDETKEKMNAEAEGPNQIADDNNNNMIAKNPACKDELATPALVEKISPGFCRPPPTAFQYYGDDIMDRFYMKSCKVCNFVTKHQKDLDTHMQGRKCKKAHVAQALENTGPSC